MDRFCLSFLFFIVFAPCPIVRSQVEERTSTTESTLLPNEKIYVCGNRIREVMRYVCPRLSNQHYYTPGTHQDQELEPDQVPHHRHRHHHSSPYYGTTQTGEPVILPKRLRRQIVKECCNQPCYEKTLLKYCGLSALGTSTLESTDELQSSEVNRQNELVNGKIHIQEGRMHLVKNQREEAQKKIKPGKAKSRPLTDPGFKKKQRRKRYISTDHDGTNRVRVGPWSRGMQVITEPPQPEPVILLPDDVSFYDR